MKLCARIDFLFGDTSIRTHLMIATGTVNCCVSIERAHMAVTLLDIRNK